MVETLNPYHMQKNLFDLLAFTGGRGTKTLGASAGAIASAQDSPLWNFHIYKCNIPILVPNENEVNIE